MFVEVKVPEVGESITEGVIASWFKKEGDIVAIDEPLFELETDKVTMTVNAEHAGRLAIKVAADTTVQIGQVVALLDTQAVVPVEGEASEPAASEPGSAAVAELAVEESSDEEGDGEQTRPVRPPAEITQGRDKLESPAAEQSEQSAGHSDEPASVSVGPALSPAVRRLVNEHQLDPAQLAASGKGGRLTKADVLRHLAGASEQLGQTPSVGEPPSRSAKQRGARQSRQRMSRLRMRVAERLVQAQQTAAILSTFNEVDMSRVIDLRARFKEQFKERYDVSLGFMSFFVKAVVEALRVVPALNGQIDGDEIVQNHFYDIGVAIGSPRGLVVPVIRDAEQLSMAQIEGVIADFADRAATGELTIDELTGGVFTISNGGVYGSLLSTPILNPPQSGILGMHGIKQRPVVVDEQIVARPMMYLAVSYDHRLVDGQQAVTFLKRIVECIEDPERMMLGV